MKSKNFTKEYLLKRIKSLSNDIFQCKCRINTCLTCIEKEKLKLNNSKLPHDDLWEWRDILKENIELKIKYQKELKTFQKIYTNKFNYQAPNSFIMCFL